MSRNNNTDMLIAVENDISFMHTKEIKIENKCIMYKWGTVTLSGGCPLIRAQFCRIFEHIHQIVIVLANSKTSLVLSKSSQYSERKN